MAAICHPSNINRQPANTLFPLGKTSATPGAIALLQELALTPFEFIARHWQGDWGDLDPEDVQANVAALRYGYRLLSNYEIGAGRRLWIITEADRSATTLLLPEEY
jgi:hypothetical protein